MKADSKVFVRRLLEFRLYARALSAAIYKSFPIQHLPGKQAGRGGASSRYIGLSELQ